jgi:hypothetical protein
MPVWLQLAQCVPCVNGYILMKALVCTTPLLVFLYLHASAAVVANASVLPSRPHGTVIPTHHPTVLAHYSSTCNTRTTPAKPADAKQPRAIPAIAPHLLATCKSIYITDRYMHVIYARQHLVPSGPPTT